MKTGCMYMCTACNTSKMIMYNHMTGRHVRIKATCDSARQAHSNCSWHLLACKSLTLQNRSARRGQVLNGDYSFFQPVMAVQLRLTVEQASLLLPILQQLSGVQGGAALSTPIKTASQLKHITGSLTEIETGVESDSSNLHWNSFWQREEHEVNQSTNFSARKSPIHCAGQKVFGLPCGECNIVAIIVTKLNLSRVRGYTSWPFSLTPFQNY